MMKFLLDQGLPRSAAEFLNASGIDTIHVGDIGASQASDDAILHIGQCQQRVVVTFDADFHALLALRNAVSPSVIRIRIQGLRGEALANFIAELMVNYQVDLLAGCIISVTSAKVRIRRLPILANI